MYEKMKAEYIMIYTANYKFVKNLIVNLLKVAKDY